MAVLLIPLLRCGYSSGLSSAHSCHGLFGLICVPCYFERYDHKASIDYASQVEIGIVSVEKEFWQRSYRGQLACAKPGRDFETGSELLKYHGN